MGINQFSFYSKEFCRQQTCSRFESTASMPDFKMSFNSIRSISIRKNGDGQKVKKGEIFRTSDLSKRVECKHAFKDLLINNNLLNDRLQEKLNYFYTPYLKKSASTAQ